ncbi:MAG TPA: VWA domain-containing protein [Candidatus Eisenbacteria bacterium]|nr:VWA domain-containing protein [Candidatus Eisenbacteria bacterium]
MLDLETLRERPWFKPLGISLTLHLALLILFILIKIPGNPYPVETVTPRFRVKGVNNLPIIPGQPGGGESKRITRGMQFSKPGAVPAAKAAADVPVQALVKSTSLKQNEMEITPKRIQLDEASLANRRDFQTILTKTEERQTKENAPVQPKSTAGSYLEKVLSHDQKPEESGVLQFLGKAIQGVNLYPTSGLGVDPEEGMPGFTPGSTGGGGAGGTGSGSPGGSPDGLIQPSENTRDITPYGALDEFLDIEVLRYDDPSDGQKYFQVKIFAKKGVRVFKVMPKEILFTVDASLSISPDRLAEFKEGITYCLKNLNKGDLFNIVAFQDRATFLSPKSVEATPENIELARKFVSSLTTNGRTDIYGTIADIVKTAPERRPSNIILISDGRPTSGVMDDRELLSAITRVNGKARPIFAFSGGRRVNRYLLDFVAYQNRAWAQYIKRTPDLAKGMAAFYDKIRDPIFINLRYRLNGVNESDTFPKSLPDFYRSAEFTLYGRFTDEKQFSMQLLGDVGGQTKELVFTRSLETAKKGDADIMKGYAFNRVYYLISRLSEGDDPKLRAEMDELSKRYGIVTPYSAEVLAID